MQSELQRGESQWQDELLAAKESLAKAVGENAELKQKLAALDAEPESATAAKTSLPGEANPVTQSSMFRAENPRNSIGVEFVHIPKGEFVMGSPTTETDRELNERPVRVTLSHDFLLGKTEVTRGQWQKVMGTTPWGIVPGTADSELPATTVSWEDAAVFCKRLTERERASGEIGADEQYRLPTEAEWEYACRAGTTTKYSFGNADLLLGAFGWFDGNSDKQTHPVGQKEPNAMGLYDMHGNVWEWCSDWRGEYPDGTVQDPQGPPVGSDRVRRGGCWSNSAWSCRSAYRSGRGPAFRSDSLGFRLALESVWIEPAGGQ